MKKNYASLLVSNQTLAKELSAHFESAHQLPPLAAKIYSILILSKEEALTFDDIIDLTKASKSSVSNQLNFLMDENRVDYCYREDKRKRYFKTKCDYLKKTLEVHLDKIQKEIEILSKVIQHKEDQDFKKELVVLFRAHLQREKVNTQQTIDKLKQTSDNLDQHEK